MSIILRIRQQGIIRPAGYQVTQWAVTIPISEPPATPPLATDPLSYADLFLTRKTEELESLERVCTLLDFEKYPVKHLEFFEAKGNGGDSFLSIASPNDEIQIQNKDIWLQPSLPPYDTNNFTILNMINRSQGLTPKCYISNTIELPGYNFTNEDIGRWVNLSGFTTPAHNGLTRIKLVFGPTATVEKSFSGNETGTSWNFPVAQIKSNFVGLEPRYFPTKENNLSWRLLRSGAQIAIGASGLTERNQLEPLARTKRFTSVMPTLDAAIALMDVTANQVQRLQSEASLNNTAFTTIITRTFGP